MSRDEAQRKQLAAVYAEQSDGALEKLWAGREGLTDTAVEALKSAMQERGLETAVEVAQPQSDSGGDSGALGPDEVELVSFVADSRRASEAIQVLDGAGIAWRMRTAIEPGSVREVLTLIVGAHSERRAQRVLDEQLGLFPGSDMYEAGAEANSDDAERVVLAMFELPEALATARALGQEGIGYTWRDWRDPAEGLPEDHVAIEVAVKDYVRARAMVDAD